MAGYTEGFTNVNGDLITVQIFDQEFVALTNAFSNSGGHTHDGSSNEGAYVPLISDQTNLNEVKVDQSNNKIVFSTNVAGTKTTQLELIDGALVPSITNDVDLGSIGSRFKDIYSAGIAYLSNLTLPAGGVFANGILDEDDMISDSATSLATQQSIKAYVDNKIHNKIASVDDKNSVEIDDILNKIVLYVDAGGIKSAQIIVEQDKLTPASNNTLSLGDIGLRFSNVYSTAIDTQQFTLLGNTITSILDEDNMASNSDTALATQQSIKAYVDNTTSSLISSHTHNGVDSPLITQISTPDGLNAVGFNDPNNRIVFFVDVGGVKTSKVAVDASALYPAATLDVDLGKTTHFYSNAYVQTLNLGSGVPVDSILDEDDMISDSATSLATQQSIKAYIDAQIGIINAGNGTPIRTSVPTTSVGSAGDKAGMIAADATYVYICHTDYDGVTAIWTRAALSTW